MTDRQAKTISLFVVCTWHDKNVPAFSKTLSFLIHYGGGMSRREALAHAERQARESDLRLRDEERLRREAELLFGYRGPDFEEEEMRRRLTAIPRRHNFVYY